MHTCFGIWHKNAIVSTRSSGYSIFFFCSIDNFLGRLSRIGVATSPGHNEQALMPTLQNSILIVSVIAFTACFDDVYETPDKVLTWFPACSLVEVSNLAGPDIYVEIEGIAHIGKGAS